MSKYVYTWEVEFYTLNGFIKREYIDAKTRAEAIKVAGAKHKIIQLITCHRVDTW